MIIINLNKLEMPYKIISPRFIDKSLEKHCDKIKCRNCKYDKLAPREVCKTAYIYGHNLMPIISYDRKYTVISDEERHLIYNQHKYCWDTFCEKCRYNHCLIRDENGDPLNCITSRIIAHRIITGEITKDQYKIKKR